PPIKESEVIVVEKPVRTYTGQFTLHGPSTVGENVELTYAADLLTVAISEPSSKFQKNLVESGACVSAGMSWFTQMNTGPINISFEAAPGNIDRCVKAVQEELPRMKAKDYLSDEEMKNAAHTIDVQTTKERERVSAFSHTLTFWWSSAGLDYYLGYVDKMKQVTRDDIARYLDTYVLGKKLVFGSLVSPQMVKNGFDKAHFEALVGLKPGPKPGGTAAPTKAAPEKTKGAK
ncbi:MAG: insulinase family protein, partial [Myxococcales bacterium]|nr:insulinase family protein [Myxococcales bacterium]